jgi:hypothetical protein
MIPAGGYFMLEERRSASDLAPPTPLACSDPTAVLADSYA